MAYTLGKITIHRKKYVKCLNGKHKHAWVLLKIIADEYVFMDTTTRVGRIDTKPNHCLLRPAVCCVTREWL